MTNYPRQELSDACIELREAVDSDGTLFLALHVEGHPVADARMTASSLREMERVPGTSRADVRSRVEADLVRRLDELYATVDLAPPRALEIADGMRLVSTYVHREATTVVAGVVWFDPATHLTGEQEVHPLVRSKMRLASMRRLAERGPSPLRWIASMLDAMSS